MIYVYVNYISLTLKYYFHFKSPHFPDALSLWNLLKLLLWNKQVPCSILLVLNTA